MVYSEKINIEKIDMLPYFDNFENVEMIDKATKCPKHAKFVHLRIHGTDIPNFVTHLSFSPYFNKSIKGGIPLSVTHITFGQNFNTSIEDSISSSVTRITFQGLTFIVCVMFASFILYQCYEWVQTIKKEKNNTLTE